jgi:hypothetical protein
MGLSIDNNSMLVVVHRVKYNIWVLVTRVMSHLVGRTITRVMAGMASSSSSIRDRAICSSLSSWLRMVGSGRTSSNRESILSNSNNSSSR